MLQFAGNRYAVTPTKARVHAFAYAVRLSRHLAKAWMPTCVGMTAMLTFLVCATTFRTGTKLLF